MLDNLARWIFELRAQVLSILSALTLLASFYATRVTLEGVHPEAPPSDPAIRMAAQTYEAAFPDARMLAVFAGAAEGARLDSADGAAWLDRVEATLQGLRGPAPAGPAKGDPLLAEDASPVRRIAEDGRSALIEAPLRPQAALNSTALGAVLEALSQASGPGRPYRLRLLMPVPQPSALSIWASSLGPLTTGAALLAGGLLAYSASFGLTALVAGVGLLAILWQIGVWAMFGGHFYAGMRLIPFIVFALVLGHGFPIARHVMRMLAAGASPAEAAASLVRRLAPAGGAALLAVALALFAAAMAPAPEARGALIFAGLGALFAFPALFIVLPLLMAGLRIDRPPEEARAEARRPRRLKPSLSLRQTPVGPQTIAILTAALALIAGLEAQTRLFGPVDAASLKSDNAGAGWVDLANAAAAGPGSSLASLSVVGRTSPDVCLRFDVLDAVDMLSWRLANLPGVTFVDSISFRLRALQAAAHGGNPRWNGLPGASVGALQAMAKIPESDALYDKQCRTLIIRVFASPPFAPVLNAVDAAVTQFRAEMTPGTISFELAGGPLAHALSEQRMLTRAEAGLFLAVMTALAAVAFFSLKDWRAATAMSVMGLSLFLAMGWTVAAIPLGLTGQTVPLALFMLLLPADMAIYVLLGWRAADAAMSGEGELPRRRLWQRDGRALASRAVSLLLCFIVWLAASDSLVRSLGVLAIVTTLTGTLTALIVIPAASMLAERGLMRRPLPQAG
jgi:predicted RND superfamily exporter protein